MLDVDAVQLSFRGVRALGGISLELREGEVLGIIGPNGSGKSTLFNVITGIYQPDAGAVRFRGASITGLDPRAVVKRGIARTYQNKRLFPSLTVLENVMVPALRRESGGLLGDMLGLPSARDGWRAARAHATECLEFVGLGTMAEVGAGSLAYGQQNRLELARALALEPAILLLDEPTAGLDPISSGEIDDLVLKLQQEHRMASVVVTHDLHSAKAIAGHLILLNEGNVVLEGTFEELQHSEDKFVKAFLKQSQEDTCRDRRD